MAATSAYATPSFVPVAEDKWVHDSARNGCTSCRESFTFFSRRHHCRACRDVFCDNCTRYRLLCRDLHDKNAIIRVRVCRPCFGKYRNDRTRTPKSAAKKVNNDTATPNKRLSSQTTPQLSVNKKVNPPTITAAASPAVTVTAPKRNAQLDRQIAQLSDTDGEGQKQKHKPMLEILKQEVEKDDAEGDLYEEYEEEEEEEEEEGDEEEEEEEEGDEEQEHVEGAAHSITEAVEEDEELSVTSLSQKPVTSTAGTDASAVRDGAAAIKELIQPLAADKETHREQTTYEGKGNETLTETAEGAILTTPRSTKSDTQYTPQQQWQQDAPIVQSSEYSKKPPTPKPIVPSSPAQRPQLPPLITQPDTPRSSSSLNRSITTPRSSITPQAAKVFAKLARPTEQAEEVSVSVSTISETVAVEKSAQLPVPHASSCAVIVSSWPPVAEEHSMAMRAHVVEATTVPVTLPLVTSAEIDSAASSRQSSSSSHEAATANTTPSLTPKLQSVSSINTSQTSVLSASILSPTMTGQVAAPPPAFASSTASASLLQQTILPQPQTEVRPAVEQQAKQPPTTTTVTHTTSAHFTAQPHTAQPGPHTKVIQPLSQLSPHPPTPANPYRAFLRPLPITVAALSFVLLCAVFPLLYSVPFTLLVCVSVPLLYSWLWGLRVAAEQQPVIVLSRDFPELAEEHRQLEEAREIGEFDRHERRRMSASLPSPTLSKDYASQSGTDDVAEDEEDEEENSQLAKQRVKLVV